MSQPDGPSFRPALAALPAYKAGRPAVSAEGRPAFKLSSNENPYAPLPGVVDAAHAALLDMNRYPDPGVVTLHERVAERFDVSPDQLASATGSVALLYQLIQACCGEGDEVVYAWRSFEAYPIAVGVSSAASVQVPLGAGARHDLDAMREAITDRTRVVIVCTPNNPTGPCVHAEELRAFLDAVPPHVVVVVDEAYREFVRDPLTVDGIELGRGRRNVVVMRTFSKAYGLAGLRIGFMVAAPDVAEAVRKCSLPFGVSSVAQAAAVASLDAEAALLERVEALVLERTRVHDALRGQGWDVPETHANFVWMPWGDRTVTFSDACMAAGVSVRPFPGDGARVTIGETEANDIFLQVAAELR